MDISTLYVIVQASL